VYDRLAAASTLDDVVRLLEAQPGIARVFRRDELGSAAAAHDRMQTAAALSYVPDLSGDLVMALKPGWTFAATGTGHGTGNPDDQRVPILMMGPGIRPGRYREAVTPADIAPTLAALSGITLPLVEGRVLRRALADGVLPFALTEGPAARLRSRAPMRATPGQALQALGRRSAKREGGPAPVEKR
jgi:arylsulfatase A-like enzyme